MRRNAGPQSLKKNSRKKLIKQLISSDKDQKCDAYVFTHVAVNHDLAQKCDGYVFTLVTLRRDLAPKCDVMYLHMWN